MGQDRKRARIPPGYLLLLLLVLASVSRAAELNVVGNWAYTLSGTTVVLDVDKISNLRTGGTSGSLRIELWAFGSPYDFTARPGYQVATYQLNGLPGGYSYNNVSSGTIAVAKRPPAGNWYMALLLTEYTGTGWSTKSYLLSPDGQLLRCSSQSCNKETASAGAATATISINKPAFQFGINDSLRLSGGIAAGNSAGVPTDIYIRASLGLVEHYHLNAAKEWVSGQTPFYTGFPLSDITAPDFYVVPTAGLPVASLQVSITLARAGTDPAQLANQIAYSAATTQITASSPGTPAPAPPASPPATPGGQRTFKAVWVNASWSGGRTGTPLRSEGVDPVPSTVFGNLCLANQLTFENHVGDTGTFLDEALRVSSSCSRVTYIAVCRTSGTGGGTSSIPVCAVDPRETAAGNFLVTAIAPFADRSFVGTTPINFDVNVLWCSDQSHFNISTGTKEVSSAAALDCVENQ